MKGAASQVDPKDLSPAWKVLQMKMKEEKEDRAREEKEKEEKMEEDGFQKVVSKGAIKKANRKRRAAEALKEAEEGSKKPAYDIPVVLKDETRGEPTAVIALDCEYVGGGSDGSTDLLARISIVNDKGEIVYDKFVKPTEKVTDFRTVVSGVRPVHLKSAIPFDTAQREASKIIKDRIVVGHALHNDFRVLKLVHGRKNTRDTAKCSVLRQLSTSTKMPSLKRLAKDVLGIEIQQGEHDSVIDARVALRLYEFVKKKWEAEIKRYRK
ncbi:unnamed protein product [Caenorhabditis auriculariae]|uniref:RNA exonuclease 4 n=1 Tax=Caenorhabditis auriculariae TaxID=2777116 RepID=A0A8S1HKB4_9PELO|nr:unnamed protein product [Caenorhabditis auriculariae]